MRLTRRGAAAVGIVVFALIQGYFFGERALNYAAAPALAALVFGTVLLWRAEEPVVERSAIRPGFPGDERRETITVEGSGIATVFDTLPEGLAGDAIERTDSLPLGLDRNVLFRERGTYALGPVTVRQRDPLGLIATTVEFDTPREVTVFPELCELDRTRVLGALFGEKRSAEDRSFDWIREYRDADPLRRIHWKYTAKHDQLLVVESEPRRRTEPIRIVVDGRVQVADELATAAASIAFLLLDEGLEVSLTLPDGEVATGRGNRHRDTLLCTLADTGERSPWGDVDVRTHLSREVHDTADVAILGESETVTIRIGDDDFPFDRLRSGSGSDSTSAGSSARQETAATRAVIDE